MYQISNWLEQFGMEEEDRDEEHEDQYEDSEPSNEGRGGELACGGRDESVHGFGY